MPKIYFCMVHVKYKTINDLINQFKRKDKLNFQETISDYYDQMNQLKQSNASLIQEDPSSKGAQAFKIIIIIAFNNAWVNVFDDNLADEPQFKMKNNIYCDLFYTTTKNLADEGGENQDLILKTSSFLSFLKRWCNKQKTSCHEKK